MSRLSNRVRVYSRAPIKRNDAGKLDDLFAEVRRAAVLNDAWRKVRSNGLASTARRTRDEIKLFDSEAHRHLRRIQSQLHSRRFSFDQQFGILQQRPGKKPRPIVIATIRNRIVQRAILDVLQDTEEIAKILNTPTSFGGIRERGREHALRFAYREIESGATVYIRSDIRDFFTRIPREPFYTFVESFIADSEFLDLLRRATETELANMAQLRGAAEHFPIHEIGVAQGCALSPLIGNIVLKGLDTVLNGRGVVCIRYIDDFLLLARNSRSAMRAFDSAKRVLQDLGLGLYDLKDSSGKASTGETRNGFDFLGCHLRPGVIQPSRAARINFRSRLKEIVESAKHSFRALANSSGRSSRSGLAQSLCELDNVVNGWGHSHAFCNAPDVMARLDDDVDEEISALFLAYQDGRRGASNVETRRLLGVQLLRDIRTVPLVATAEACSAISARI